MNHLILVGSLIWLELFRAERYYKKERFMRRTHDHSAHEVMIHFYWDILQIQISEKLSCQVYIFSHSFLPSFLSILHMIMKGPNFILLLHQYILNASKASFLVLTFFSEFLPSIQNLSFSGQLGTSPEPLAGVDECQILDAIPSGLLVEEFVQDTSILFKQ